MRALRFELRGETAFFKKPDVNVHAYFTYSHIHKVALYGLLGAIIGLGGYAQQHERNSLLARSPKSEGNAAIFPVFYEVFRDAWVSIVPHGDRGYFSKKIQIFNNTVGYASQEAGGVLNVREQWLERPHWTVYVADYEGLSRATFERLADYILNSKAEYMPYLGKNDHPATILKPSLIEIEKPEEAPYYIDSLRSAHIGSNARGTIKNRGLQSFFKEHMPIGMNAENNGYMMKPLVFTNHEIDSDTLEEEDWNRLYVDGEQTLYFI
ncbi:type I-B CRISPR-associated protein Cas5b [Paenibacillus sp. MER TA 81-3]|uniref:type I-B CRISPR-associated protein Cas5b n=1 Tax=Paenibacillus sp. MER TA 81-3 TaxID=2939573 RepID=UPI00203B4BDC|nr:type I-B CRISPR-associated protein Cas5b [Paenibacillus sp. MER TA 81-3]MCM3337623.1 type I-B CRISPR-associated protein Cas5b [Paenibacillus sp. MER TA 81-3]